MPSPQPSLTRSSAFRIAEACFATDPPRHVGVEIEWITRRKDEAGSQITAEDFNDLLAALGDLPGGGRITIEPGGQIELSSAAAPDITSLHEAVTRDLEQIATVAGDQNLELNGAGIDPRETARRILDAPRYTAMETYFDTFNNAGRTMMRRTASIQVNLDAGPADRVAERWRRAHALVPILTAAFSNSPSSIARSTNGPRRSERQAVWAAIDPSRTTTPMIDRSPPAAWYDYALEARVMMIRESDDTFAPQTEPMTFDEWLTRGAAVGWPTEDDFKYHLTTLFPPVRPRGWLEFRVIDALPDRWWPVPVAASLALIDDPLAAAAADHATEKTEGLWLEAAEQGMSHPDIRDAAEACFEAVIDALPRLGANDAIASAVIEYHETYIRRGRSPADERAEDGDTSGLVGQR